EGKFSALLRREIRAPIVIHYPRKNGGRLRTKFLRPVASYDVAETYQRRVVWDHGCHESRVVYRGPVLHGIPLMASTRQFVLGGVHPAVLSVVAKFGTIRGERKRDVNRLLLYRRLFGKLIHKVNLLPVVVECNLEANRWCIRSRCLHRNDRPERHLFRSHQVSAAGGGSRQCRGF